VFHCQGSVPGGVAPQQLIQTWLKTSCQHLQSQMTAVKSFMKLHRIMNAAQQILIEGSCRVEPPVVLISRYGSLTSEQQEAVSNDLIKMAQSGASSNFMHAIQADVMSTLVRELTAVQPPMDFASQKIINDFLDAVKRVSDCVDLSLQDESLTWSVRPTVQGCGPDCSESHNVGDCLVCGHGWGAHGGHTCNRAPFTGRRGSWLPSSQAAPVGSLHVETSPGTIKVSLDPKCSEMEGIQSENSLKSDPDKEMGTVITFNIIHNSASAPKVIVGLSLTPPPLIVPVAAKVSLGLDLGNLKFIDNVEKGKDSPGLKLTSQLNPALSISPSVIK
jgi:hypothetical protein